MSQEGRGCLVAVQGGSDKVAQFKNRGSGSGPAVPPLDPRKFISLLESLFDIQNHKHIYKYTIINIKPFFIELQETITDYKQVNNLYIQKAYRKKIPIYNTPT